MWPEANFEVKTRRQMMLRALLEVETMKRCMALWCEVRFQATLYQTLEDQGTPGILDVEKVPTVVARSKYRGRQCKNLLGSEHSGS